MLTINDEFPEFELKAVVPSEGDPRVGEIIDVRDDDWAKHWKCVFFYPKDFTFVCPTEIKGFADLHQEFKQRQCQILAVSTDSEYAHLAWRNSHPDLQKLPFPMLADINKKLAGELGILTREGVAMRAAFIVDPGNTIRFVYVTDGEVGRSPQEVLRVLDALQTGELCGCDWHPGEKFVNEPG